MLREESEVVAGGVRRRGGSVAAGSNDAKGFLLKEIHLLKDGLGDRGLEETLE